jgi:hypothetical protein
MKRTAMQHTKLKKLMRKLNLPQWGAVGLLESLWHLTAREALMGDIGKLTDEDIAIAIDWKDEPQVLIDALVDAGWIDRSEMSRLVVHDWEEHADDATKKAIERHRKKTAENGGHLSTESEKNRLPLPLPLPLPEPEPCSAPLDPAIASRGFGERVGNTNIRFQEQMSRLIQVKSTERNEPLEKTVEWMVGQWDKYNRARPKLNFPKQSAEKFFESGTWHDENLWPWKEGHTPPIPKERRRYLNAEYAHLNKSPGGTAA